MTRTPDPKDTFRRPYEVLAWAGLRPEHRVLDVTTGFGYWARVVGDLVSTRVDMHNGSEWEGFFRSVGLDAAIEDLVARPEKFVHRWSSMADPASGRVDEYDLVVCYNTFHDLYDQPIDRADFFASIRRALKADGRFLLIDHHAGAGRGAKDAGANRGLHRIELPVVLREIQDNGFEVDKQTDLLRFGRDDYATSAWTSPMHETDRFCLLLKRA